ncbi:hypothetical protein ACQP2P_29650 [Dactylosporangium sp. CA-139114]|uniref:hypothetical protein n=1 Tax=Dactylosporangium sp. CA-139114 TaxID=3239931 RepID=UPI003D967B17
MNQETPVTLRQLYFTRFGFAIVWAALVLVTGADRLGPATVALLVLYPAFDVAAAIVDARGAGARKTRLLYANIAISTLAAIGLAVACASGIPAVLRVWGAWAIVAGLVQLFVALGRRAMGGQWAMILSGGLSVLAGTSFVLAAGADDPALTNVAGYATVGGIFFLVSALRLRRAANRPTQPA